MKAVKKLFPTANIQIGKGTAKDNKAYLSKQNLIFEKGTPHQQGKRNDLTTAMEDIKNGITQLELYNNHSKTVAKFGKFLNEYRNLVEPKRDWPTECIVLYGPTGTGKTRMAKSENATTVEYINGFFNGYKGEDTVLFDEFDWTSMPKTLFLKITDRYDYEINVKGGTRNWKPRKIFFCTNDENPEQTWYRGDPAVKDV